jgi:phosphatidylserine/phosphatidylglycerophosphate/cardiolipin synthase-like enzyme
MRTYGQPLFATVVAFAAAACSSDPTGTAQTGASQTGVSQTTSVQSSSAQTSASRLGVTISCAVAPTAATPADANPSTDAGASQDDAATADDASDGDGTIIDDKRKKDSGAPAADTRSAPSDAVGVASGIALKVQPDDGESWFVTQIADAKTSVHLETYMLTDTDITNALIAAKKRGVDVKVIVDPAPFGQPTANQAAYNALKSAGVGVEWSRSDVTYTHAKFMILDGNTLDVMTLNQTYSAYVYEREYALVTTHPAAVNEAATLFAADYAKTSVSASLLVVSPVNSRADITHAIESAKKTLDIEVEEIDDATIATALTSAVARGVTVRMIVNASEASSETAILSQLKAGRVEIRIMNANTTLDAKAMVVDGSSLFVGSENFSTGSLDYNREVGLFTTDPASIARYETAFSTDFASATTP